MASAGIELASHGADRIGRCPFHEDRTPSLVVSPEKNLWRCLGIRGDLEDGALISLISESNRAATQTHIGGKNRACDCGRFDASCDTEGNGRRAVFYSDEDRKVYLQLLWE